MNFFETLRNGHGASWSERRASARQVDELIGICRGVLLDGNVNRDEASGLLAWLEAHKDVTTIWPGSAIYPRLVEALADGNLDSAEESAILELIGRAVGNEHATDAFGTAPSQLPWDDPAPEIVHKGQQFCITGEFVRAPRGTIVRMIESRGGRFVDGVSGKTNYLLVGMNGSAEWKHGNFGTKIAKAVEFRASGRPIKIVSERRWIEFT